MSQLDSQI